MTVVALAGVAARPAALSAEAMEAAAGMVMSPEASVSVVATSAVASAGTSAATSGRVLAAVGVAPAVLPRSGTRRTATSVASKVALPRRFAAWDSCSASPFLLFHSFSSRPPYSLSTIVLIPFALSPS